MATYQDDFSSYTVGDEANSGSPDAIANWTAYVSSGNWSAIVVAAPGAIGDQGLELRNNGSGSGSFFLYNDVLGQIPANTAIDIKARFSVNADSDYIRWNIETLNSATPEQNRTYNTDTYFRAYRSNDGSGGNSGWILDQLDTAHTYGTYVWMRVRQDTAGNTEGWFFDDQGIAEPAWGAAQTTGFTTSQGPGHVALGGNNFSAMPIRIDFIGVGTAGDEAPGPAPAGPTVDSITPNTPTSATHPEGGSTQVSGAPGGLAYWCHAPTSAGALTEAQVRDGDGGTYPFGTLALVGDPATPTLPLVTGLSPATSYTWHIFGEEAGPGASGAIATQAYSTAAAPLVNTVTAGTPTQTTLPGSTANITLDLQGGQGTYWAAIYALGSNPSHADIKAGTGAGYIPTTPSVDSGTLATTPSTPTLATFSGLAAETDYELFVTAEDGVATPAIPAKDGFTTLAADTEITFADVLKDRVTGAPITNATGLLMRFWAKATYDSASPGLPDIIIQNGTTDATGALTPIPASGIYVNGTVVVGTVTVPGSPDRYDFDEGVVTLV